MAPARCCSARRRSAASSTSSTPASRATCPTSRSGSMRWLNYGTAANERSANARRRRRRSAAISSLTPTALIRNMTTFTSAGYLLSRRRCARRRWPAPIPAIRALADLKDKLPNTAGRIDDVAGGVAYVDGDLNIGLSYSHHDAQYGVPIRFSLDPGDRGRSADHRCPPGPRRCPGQHARSAASSRLFEFRGGISKYHHDELEPDGAIGSSFFTDGGELRADVVQTERGGWGGTSGVQYLDQDAGSAATRNICPTAASSSSACSRCSRWCSRQGPLRSAARASSSTPRSTPTRIAADRETRDGSLIGDAPDQPQLHRLVSARSAPITSSCPVGARACRCRTASGRRRSTSCFANGPHGGSQQFLIGNPDLGLEKSNGAELSVHRTTGPMHVQGSIYYSRFSNFIFQAPTGEVEDGLPVYRISPGQGRLLWLRARERREVRQGAGYRLGRRAGRPTRFARRSRASAPAPADPAVPRTCRR